MFLVPLFCAFLLPILLLPELLVNAREADYFNRKYHITGTLYCFNPENGLPEPMDNMKIALWEKDYWHDAWAAHDDHMGDGVVKAGKFELRGSEDEHGLPDPYIYIEHSCKDPARNYPKYATTVWIKPDIEEQELYIYLGQGERAEMRVQGRDAVPLKVETVEG